MTRTAVRQPAAAIGQGPAAQDMRFRLRAKGRRFAGARKADVSLVRERTMFHLSTKQRAFASARDNAARIKGAVIRPEAAHPVGEVGEPCGPGAPFGAG
ncbi:hypothetical protein GCM10009738_31030 [Kitasatospora viridis]